MLLKTCGGRTRHGKLTVEREGEEREGAGWHVRAGKPARAIMRCEMEA